MKFITDYHKHDERLYRYINPMPLDAPKLGALNRALIDKLGLGSLSDNDWQDVISGRLTPLASQSPHGLQPIAMAYAGHQFGQWAGQLGDGRGLLIAQLMDDDGRLTDLHLKGAGRTPYSRHGDGRAMIASTIREYLCGHALNCLGIGSSDAIGFVVSDTPIQRYQMERAAALLRVSDCHVRLGHIEWVAMYAPDYLSGFITHICQSYYPSLYDSTSGTADVPALIKQIAINTARMIAKWQLVGFSHGVMNTDNLNITGTTLDFGPFGFMESFNPAWINNHSDHTGRYTYQNQPMIGYWNLATVFKNLQRIGVTPSAIDDALDSYEQALQETYHDGLAHKLGFAKASDETTALGYELLDLMKTYQLDYTNTFRALIAVVDGTVDNMANDTHSDTADTHERRLLDTLTRGLPHKALDTWQAWVARFTHLIQVENDTQAVIQRLTAHNPVYVLRNHMAHTAITHALVDDFGEVQRLFEILSTPYQVNPKAVTNDITPALADQQIAVSCLS